MLAWLTLNHQLILINSETVPMDVSTSGLPMAPEAILSDSDSQRYNNEASYYCMFFVYIYNSDIERYQRFLTPILMAYVVTVVTWWMYHRLNQHPEVRSLPCLSTLRGGNALLSYFNVILYLHCANKSLL